MFEEEIEIKWEKGGSGLVFYTDAQYWQAQEGGMLMIKNHSLFLPEINVLVMLPVIGAGILVKYSR